MISADSTFAVRADVRYRLIDDEAVVVQQTANQVIVLNEVSARILDSAAQGLAVEAMVKRLALAYEIDGDTLREDTLAHLQELLDAGIIEEQASPGAAI